MRNGGYVKIWRKSLDNPWLRKHEVMGLWVTLLLLATHKPKDVIFDAKRFTLQPGQLVTSRKSLAKSTGLHESTVERVLKRLKIEQQIEQVTDYRCRLITIVNWTQYQQIEQVIEQPANRSRTGPEHTQEGKNKSIDIDPKKDLYLTPTSESVGARANGTPEKVIAHFNERTGKNLRMSKADETLIKARIKVDGATLEEFQAIIDFKVSKWANDPERREFLRPRTLFSAGHWSDYLADATDPVKLQPKPPWEL